ncbi:MAG: fructosamine kinase family protein [Opitutales bacterium]
MTSELQQALSSAIREATGQALEIRTLQPQGGGCINEAWLLEGGSQSYFVKLNTSYYLSMFKAETAALKELAATKAIRVPQPLTHGKAENRSYLVLEALPFGSPNSGSWEAMGQELARLHRSTNVRFGWQHDNFIGSTPQQNEWTSDWPGFFREQRLRPQFELAQSNGYKFDHAEDLLNRIEDLLAGHTPAPSLLHGDLWSGNAGFLDDGMPVIYDPATYYGDRETDLAFSEFFGGFPASFYRAYQNEWPLPSGYEKRKILYNLYHALNHANLFGGGYASQAEAIIHLLIN